MKIFCSPTFYIDDSDGKKKEKTKVEKNTFHPPMIIAKINILQKSSYPFHWSGQKLLRIWNLCLRKLGSSLALFSKWTVWLWNWDDHIIFSILCLILCSEKSSRFCKYTTKIQTRRPRPSISWAWTIIMSLTTV